MARGLLGVAIWVVAFQALAATDKWPQEPSTFLGVAFDKPLRESIKKTCPKDIHSIDEAGAKKLGEPCFEWPDKKRGLYFVCCYFDVFPLSGIVVVRNVGEKVDAPVGEVRVVLDRSGFARAARLLSEKYGPPHRTESISPLKDVLIWEGGNLTIITPSTHYAEPSGDLRVFSARFWGEKETNRLANEKKAAGRM